MGHSFPTHLLCGHTHKEQAAVRGRPLSLFSLSCRPRRPSSCSRGIITRLLLHMLLLSICPLLLLLLLLLRHTCPLRRPLCCPLSCPCRLSFRPIKGHQAGPRPQTAGWVAGHMGQAWQPGPSPGLEGIQSLLAARAELHLPGQFGRVVQAHALFLCKADIWLLGMEA